MAKGNKKAAMLCLQQKKMYEQEVERMQNVILNMMKQKQELEGMSHTQEVVSAQKLATDAQKVGQGLLRGMEYWTEKLTD